MIIILITVLFGFFFTVQPVLESLLNSNFTNDPQLITGATDGIAWVINFALNGFWFCVDLLCIPHGVITMCLVYITAKLTVPFIAGGIKLILRWYTALMPTK